MMETTKSGEAANKPVNDDVAKGIGTSVSDVQTKGRYVVVEQEPTGSEWGIVHLYRDANETPGLYKDAPLLGTDLWNGGSGVPKTTPAQSNPPAKDEDCTTLCILAVPSYLSPSDFLAFVGEETRDIVSHFRMIRTARANRYMVLMKFKNGKQAREWQHDWNGRVFNSMEPETCHVVFLKSVEIMQSSMMSSDPLNSPIDGSRTFPRMNNDPFASTSQTAKPLAPRTPSLIELPTCPVCLERMDETTGLLTILCQHVFHCTCLEKWSGGGCPVCRYTHDDFSTRSGTSKLKSSIQVSEYEILNEPLECETCHADTSLWQCLICGNIGCGRYEGKHAYTHFEETGHVFSMDLENKRVWDYAADVYVHRIIQEAAKPGEKLVELPGRSTETTAFNVDEDIEMAKMQNVALEYTHLLTSQLESQRVYFEDIVQRTTDKASEATKRAERATSRAQTLEAQLEDLVIERNTLADTKIPHLESEKQRIEKRVSKSEELARSMNSKYLEEKSLVSSLMERVKHLEENKLAALQQRIQELEEENATKELLMEGLRDEHRDAMLQISAQTRLREMVEKGELDEADLEGATIEAGPAAKNYGRKPAKGKDKAVEGPKLDKVQNIDNELLRMLRERIGVDLQASETWNDDTAAEVFQDLKQNMLNKGLLKEKQEQDVSQTSLYDGEEENVEATASISTTAKAKKKKKAKNKPKNK